MPVFEVNKQKRLLFSKKTTIFFEEVD